MVCLLLFDIDLTLIRYRPKDTGRGAMVETLSELYGLDSQDVLFTSVAGKTDPLIVAEMFKINDIPYDPERDYAHFMQHYLDKLRVSCANGERVVLPGVRDLLCLLTSQPARFRLGVLTGNDERGARMKLEGVGLNHFFPIGAYGSDAPLRKDLLPFALKRAQCHYRLEFGSKQVIIIGDSILDIKAAKVHGAQTMGVTTGYDSKSELLEAGADVVVEGFQDPQHILNLLVTLSGAIKAR